MLHNVQAVLADDAGQGLAEYGLILGLIAAVCVAAVAALRTQINAALGSLAGKL